MLMHFIDATCNFWNEKLLQRQSYITMEADVNTVL